LDDSSARTRKMHSQVGGAVNCPVVRGHALCNDEASGEGPSGIEPRLALLPEPSDSD
jgi:hypothetical protein